MSEPNEPARPGHSEPDSDQLPLEDTLVDRGVDDVLEEGYSPPDHPRANHWGETPLEEVLGESLDRRLAQEQPEVWEEGGEQAAPQREPDRTGRLAVDPDEDDDPTGTGSQSVMADDVGVAGGGASGEEAAMHLVPEDDADDDGPVPDGPFDGAAADGATADDDDLTGPED